MTIDGHFTQEEIRSAIDAGATIEKLKYKKIKISFKTKTAFNAWLKEQKESRPDLWESAMVLKPSKKKA